MSDSYPFPRRASPGSPIGSHVSGISHPPGSRKIRQSMVMDGMSSDALLKQIEGWDDGQSGAQSNPSGLGFGGLRQGEEEAAAWTSALDTPQSDQPCRPSSIPWHSMSEADKRKANRDASRRFRNRKRNGELMEKKVDAQQDEIRKQSELLQRQGETICTLTCERDFYRKLLLQQQDERNRILTYEREFYRSERDFYRDLVKQLLPDDQLLLR